MIYFHKANKAMDKKVAADKAVTPRDAAPEFSGGLAALVDGGDEGMLVPPGDGAPVTLTASFWPASQWPGNVQV